MTYYGKVSNGEIVKLNVQLPFADGNTSFGMNTDATTLAEFNYYPIVGNEPQYDPAIERMMGPAYEFDGEQINRVYTVDAIPQSELDAQHNSVIKGKIAKIEATQARAVREATLSGDTTYLAKIDADITALREQLK